MGPAPSPIISTNSANAGSAVLRIGIVSLRILKLLHSAEDLMDASIICNFEPLRITGHVCQKSPAHANIFPPNGKLF